MRILVIHAHPVAESFNRALFDLTVRTLADGGHEVRTIDLYARGFDPVLTAAGRRHYHDHGLNAAPVAEDLRLLAWCNGLVFVYPTWWYAQPAILKGWLDRVWVPHVCFSLPTENRPVGALMQHIALIGGISTYGAPRWFTWWVGDPGRRILLRGIKPILHPRCRSFWCGLYRMDTATAAQRAAFLDVVRGTLARLPPERASTPVQMGDQALWWKA